MFPSEPSLTVSELQNGEKFFVSTVDLIFIKKAKEKNIGIVIVFPESEAHFGLQKKELPYYIEFIKKKNRIFPVNQKFSDKLITVHRASFVKNLNLENPKYFKFHFKYTINNFCEEEVTDVQDINYSNEIINELIPGEIVSLTIDELDVKRKYHVAREEYKKAIPYRDEIERRKGEK